MQKINIKNMSAAELLTAVEELGEKRHRAAQIFKWLYQKGCGDFSGMTNLPTSLRRTLGDRFTITWLRLAESVRSHVDASQKFLLASDDGALIEAVLMDAHGHRTICISSQVGCALGCALCRTGDGGFERNLRSDEILNQVLFFKAGHIPPRERFNIVFMGMGEPLLNLDNLARALEIINSPDAFALGEKRITVSTIGIPEAIRELGASRLKFSLAVSLNATTDEARKRLMPAARSIDDTLAAAIEFARARKTRVTLEYVLIDGVNDTQEDARRLAGLTAAKPFKLNLIPFNEWNGCAFRRPSDERIDSFIAPLLPQANAVTVRRSQGGDIHAACGQLRMRRES
ncbi:MAG: 23S rRNA (adenine(2503)-C(2))-methyltransferase RlmN [Candidatus Krumholzibacteria bacterium]|nr:23S rRNA (adenine(2503)-C(2))-methyltransferase RlmN [Candidatus Krumholzibacteria bacterium]